MKITAINKINVRTTITFLFFLSLIVLTAFIFKYNFASAGTGESVQGFAWGGTQSLGGYQGLGWISLNNITDGSAINYGVNVPATDGNLSGFAWSEHYGWISFNGADLAGCSPVLNQAKITGVNVTGGARIIAIRDAGGNAGGFDGCISLSGSSYQVTAVDSGLGYKLLQGYAWSSDLGWIDFDISGSPVPVSLAAPTGFTATAGLCNTGTINLKWNLVAGATSYTLKDGATTIYTGSLLTFTQAVANDGATHNYTVMASKGADNSALTATSAVAPISCSAVPPVPVVTGSAGACDSGAITVNWSSSGATKYTIKDGATTLLTDTPLTSKTFTVPSNGFTHSYTAMATNLNGSSAYSAVKNIAAPDACGSPAPSGSITASTCEIPISGSSCSSNVSWSSNAFTGSPSVRQNGVQFSNSPNSSASKSVNPDNQTFTLVDTGSGFTASANANATCASGSSWDGSICAPIVVSTPPIINSVTATPKLIRSGQTSTITAVVTHSEDSVCEFKGAKSNVVSEYYFGVGVDISRSVVTRPLTSSQIVEVECYPVSDPLNKIIATPVRVDIVPTVQEI